ncbi:MAG TPA: bifunctional hydroxymethylpyrimidine kinase/phosphomethylpyrimidine kinase [Thermoanaerobaculia bacterium]|nr:bifunctional hydroxymethylpyrimidine kinase/phosphomethylpyrimidine kinase [Thermoanaerobaculia bacterium]
MTRRTPPRLLTIAGSDSGGGAGIQADLKTFAAHGAYGMSVIAALTAQNTREVRAVLEVPPAMVEAQIDAVLEDIGADAVKIGMLASAEVIRTVADRLRFHLMGPEKKGVPVVLDPVMVAKSGDRLLREDAVEALIAELLPLAALVTPNLPELEVLTGLPAGTEEERLRAAEALAGRGPAVLAKGGHAGGEKSEEVVDLLLEGGRVHRFAHPRLYTRSTHGTGCTLSSAIAARLGAGEDLPRAVEGAIDYLREAMAAAYPVGSGNGHGPVDHFYLMGGRKT